MNLKQLAEDASKMPWEDEAPIMKRLAFKDAITPEAFVELLGALELFVKQWNACGPNSDFGRYFQSTYTQARAAIAKATGSAA